MDLAPPRGTLDLLPPAGGRMRAVYDRAAELARRYGYRYVETPVFEHTEVFSRTSGETSDVVSKEMYTFEDRGGRSLTLRPEGTAPVMRAYLDHRATQPVPFKGYYLTRMYRYDRPQAGRYREHRQFGVEVFGVAEPGADVEVVVVGDELLRRLGLRRYELQVNSIGDEVCDRRTGRARHVPSRERRRLRDDHRNRPKTIRPCARLRTRDAGRWRPRRPGSPTASATHAGRTSMRCSRVSARRGSRPS
jgi:histidyl-tRNA synthetase